MKRYTHQDKTGMRWRFVGSRPVSELADKVMANVIDGLQPIQTPAQKLAAQKKVRADLQRRMKRLAKRPPPTPEQVRKIWQASADQDFPLPPWWTSRKAPNGAGPKTP